MKKVISYVYTKSYTSAREGEERRGEERRAMSYQRNGASPGSLTSAIDGRSSHDSRLTRHRTARSVSAPSPSLGKSPLP